MPLLVMSVVMPEAHILICCAFELQCRFVYSLSHDLCLVGTQFSPEHLPYDICISSDPLTVNYCEICTRR
jgi:hypothetical protein